MVTQHHSPDDEAPAAPGRLFDSALAGQVKASAQQIWLAGMGAFARAQEEGNKVFEALVKEGTALQKKTASAAEDKFDEVSSKVSGVQARAGQGWDKLESIFEERTAKALKRLGVPSARDVDALSARVDELSAKVTRLAKAASVKKAAAAKPAAKAPARKASAKRATTRKPTAARS